MNTEAVQKLATMMRMEISAEEAESIGRDMDAVIGYIDQLSQIDTSTIASTEPLLSNIAREDVATNDSGSYTEQILAEVPEVDNGFVKVKKVM